MSYSFSVKAATKAEVKRLVAAKLDEMDVLVSVSGSVSTNDTGVYAASVGVNAQRCQRIPAVAS